MPPPCGPTLQKAHRVLHMAGSGAAGGTQIGGRGVEFGIAELPLRLIQQCADRIMVEVCPGSTTAGSCSNPGSACPFHNGTASVGWALRAARCAS